MKLMNSTEHSKIWQHFFSQHAIWLRSIWSIRGGPCPSKLAPKVTQRFGYFGKTLIRVRIPLLHTVFLYNLCLNRGIIKRDRGWPYFKKCFLIAIISLTVVVVCCDKLNLNWKNNFCFLESRQTETQTSCHWLSRGWWRCKCPNPSSSRRRHALTCKKSSFTLWQRIVTWFVTKPDFQFDWFGLRQASWWFQHKQSFWVQSSQAGGQAKTEILPLKE